MAILLIDDSYARRPASPLRTAPPGDSVHAGRGRTARRGLRRGPADRPADGVETPVGAARGRPGDGAQGRPAAAVQPQPRPASATGSMAGRLPPSLDRSARCAGSASRQGVSPLTDTASAIRLGADAGTLTPIEGGWELRFERRLRHAPERVWKALTSGDGLACWLAEADIDLVPGGAMELNFRQPDHEFMPDTPERRRQSNEVLTVEPFTRFDHTFGGVAASVVSWRLAPDGDGTHLTLIHRIPESWAGARSNVLSGWHHHMEGLDGAARGVPHGWAWDRWFALRDAYAEQLS